MLGVKLIDVATNTLRDLVDGKLGLVNVELQNVTIVELRGRKFGDVLFDNVVEEELGLLGGTLGRGLLWDLKSPKVALNRLKSPKVALNHLKSL